MRSIRIPINDSSWVVAVSIYCDVCAWVDKTEVDGGGECLVVFKKCCGIFTTLALYTIS